ncbi:uncharacterized protein SAPINGB_P003549 [Magnusiomyces paraingens]|uniref:Phosphoribosylaminoimidazole-succinocarboxamide synthase n=1 Tax=Magnusiomyces paraingens TaxID=2606893 RepID=A0A5E8BS73_9ASCO|nr:uncharacterized protein SAPINGB_P003549 [Saprochaete ingens]VVT53389.1 unnamed protein product [Saprochaete ingens]
MSAVTSTDLKGALPFLAKGKVRDIYTVSDDSLLFVATDRISAYDVIMENGIPDKGKLLTKLSQFWFKLLGNEVKTHLVGPSFEEPDEALFKLLPDSVSKNPELRAQLIGRSLLVNKFKLIPLEVIVRGYITGSAWSEYKKSGTVHGIKVAPGLQESEQFATPLYTPSTKAEQGEHDENIHPDRAVEILGGDKELAAAIEALAIKLYVTARDYAKTRGIIIADTKFEFGYIENEDGSKTLVLVDEVLTPDSSRFWRADSYVIGQGQDSYDKQFLRNWLTDNNLKGKDGVTVPEDIVENTRKKYIEAYESITGEKYSS